jgi:hypothetical protein
MSRVVYTDTPATAAQEALRITHKVRLVTPAEEGTGVDALPEGVYGFTYSPGLPNAPLFAARRFRCYETHKLAGGSVFIVGFVAPAVARQIETGDGEQTVLIHPEPDDQATTLVRISYARIRQHRQYAAPNQHGFTVTLLPRG